MSEWFPYVATVAGSVVASYLTFYIRFERFKSMDEQREKDWLAWRYGMDTKTDRIDNRLRDHEKYCDGRWNQQNRDVGEIRGMIRRGDER